MPTLEHAIALAAQAHTGQVDKAGQPYILHPLRIMLACHDLDEKIVAVLHDVVEDTAISLQDLRTAGFAEYLIAAIDALTKRRGESRLDAAQRAKQNPIARKVKQADVTDNMDLSRIAQPTAKDHARLTEYQQVLAILQND